MSQLSQLTISASRVAALMGQSKWQTRLALYYELSGKGTPKDDNELLMEGRMFERAIAEIACKKFGFDLVDGPKELRHGDLSGHPDFYVFDGGKLAILEVKNTLFDDAGNEERGWGEPGTDRVPPAYWLQCQTYGHLLTKAGVGSIVSDYTYLAARLRSGVTLYKIPNDPAVIKQVELEASALLDRVARQEPPDPVEEADFRRRWLPDPEKGVELGYEQVAQVRTYRELGRQIKAMEEQRSSLAILLLGYLRDAGSGEWEGKRLLSATANREFDEDRFLVECPEVAAMCQTLDKGAVKKHSGKLYDTYMRQPDPANQTRVLRVNDKNLDSIQ